MTRKLSFSMPSMIGGLVVAFLALAAMAVMATAYFQVRAGLSSQAVERQEMLLKTAATVMERDVPGATVQWTADGEIARLTIDPMPEFASHEMIDAVSRASGEKATVFAYDAAKDDFVRVTTSILKPDGSRAVGTVLGRSGAVFPVIKAGATYHGEAAILGVDHFTIYMPTYDAAGSINGILFAGIPKQEVLAVADDMMFTTLVASLAIILVLALLGWFVAVRIVSPIPRLSAVMRRLADNDLSQTIPYAEKSNEIGEIARAIEVFRDSGRARASLEAEQRRQEEALQNRQRAVDALIRDFQSEVRDSLGAVTGSMEEMRGISVRMTELSSRSSDRAGSAAGASMDASRNVESVASAAEELASSISEIAGQVSRTTEIVSQAAKATRSTNQQIGGLAEAATKIGEVVNLIQAIAEQTNLLALNATIEAARAGDAGRGFAVVATEVKSLAAQTAKATEEIASQISGIQASTGDAVMAIQSITATMDEVDRYTAAIAAAVEEQGAATNEISRNVAQASAGTRSVSQTMETVTDSLGQTIKSAEQVSASSEQVMEKTGRLHAAVDRFLERVAAA